jgi:hypothetical protein
LLPGHLLALLLTLLAERLLAALLPRLLLAEWLLPCLQPGLLPGLLPGLPSRNAYELLQPCLDIALAVVRAIRDALHEIVDTDRRVEVRRADLGKLVQDPVTDLPPVRPQHLLDLLGLLLLHMITSPLWSSDAEQRSPRPTERSTLGDQFPPKRRSPLSLTGEGQ